MRSRDVVIEAIKTSAIEGELLSRKDVMSSMRKNLGLKTDHPTESKRVQGVAVLILAFRNSFVTLSQKRCGLNSTG